MRSLGTLLALLLVAGFLAGGPALAQTPKGPAWVKIAAKEAGGPSGEIVFDMTGRRDATWRSLRLEVKASDLAISRVEIRYASGARYTETRLISLLEGERTRPLDPGPDRVVTGVTIAYQREVGRVQAAVVELWGQEGSADRRPVAETPPLALPVAASREVLLGVQRPAYRDASDAYTIGDVGRFSRLRLRVHENEIHVAQVVVFYADGETETQSIEARVAAGTTSAWITVKPDRFIRRVEVVYKSRPSFRGAARVELVGEVAEGWLGPRGPGRDFNGGWVLLGAQTAGFVGFDRDLIPVGINEGGFRNLRVTVRDRTVTLDELRVVYARGGAQVIRLGHRVEPGANVGPIALDPDRAIVEIRARYRSRYFDRGATGWRPAIVEVWGQH